MIRVTGTATGVRPATFDDVAPIRAVVDAVEPPPADAVGGHPAAIDAYYAHLIERGEVLVVEESERMVAFGATIDSGRGVHLADLFVVPDRQGRGLGRTLLERLFGDRWPRTTFSSDDPRAMPLYIRMGMLPLWPNLYLSGDARRLPDPPAGLTVQVVTADEVAALEREWAGIDRPVEHRYWAGQPGNTPLIVTARRRRVAAGHARERLRGVGRWMNMLLVRPAEEPHDATLAAIRASADDAGRIGTCVLGPHPIVPTLVAAGFRIVDRDTYQASERDLIDPARLLVNTGIL